MSYKTIRRLVGETGLERKVRALLGAALLALVCLGFYLAAYRTERLVWEQSRRTAQLLVNHVVEKQHLKPFADAKSGKPWESALADAVGRLLGISAVPKAGKPRAADADDRFVLEADDASYKYQSRVLLPQLAAPPTIYKASTDFVDNLARRLVEQNKSEDWEADERDRTFVYLKAVRAKASCVNCHDHAVEKITKQPLKEGDLMAVVNVRFPLADTELAISVNRAILLSFAIGLAALAMLFTYMIVRYVVVKPLAHLQNVSDEVAAGNLAVRAELKSGDEFSALSDAFNRMLRTLTGMQDELRKVNADLDRRLDDLATANLSLYESNRLKSDFLATISHELRTPLNSILGFGDLLHEGDGLPDRKRRWVTNILESGRHLLGLVNDILDLAKLEAGKMRRRPEDFSLRDLVEAQLQVVRPLADRKSLALVAEIDPALPRLRQDAGKLGQILSNLLSNAIKFTPEGGRVSVRAAQDRAHFVLAVEDNGIGLAPEDQKLVFDKFRQAEGALTRAHGGTGLGLSIVRELTKLLGGDDVRLESQLGQGSVFTIRLPIQLAEQPAEPLELPAPAAEPAPPRGPQFYSSRDSRAG